MSKSTEEATVATKDYLSSTNRPYSSNDIINNLQNKFTKAAVTKALEALVSSNDVCERVNGKQKIYFCSQDKFEIDVQKLKELDDKADKITKEIEKIKESIVMKEQNLKGFVNHVPLKQLEEQLEAIQKEISDLEDKSRSIKVKCENIDPESNTKIKKAHKKLVTEWKSRKRLASQIFDSILESYSKPKKAFFEEVGIDDDDPEVKIPTV